MEDLYGSVTISRTDYDLQKSLVTNIDEKRSIAEAAAKMVEVLMT